MSIELARPTPRQTRVRAVTLMVSSVFLLTLMDAVVKALTARYPVLLIMAFRCFLAVPVLLLALPRDGGLTSLVRVRPGLQLLRGALGFMTALCYFKALAELPLADTLAVSFSAPLFVALLSRPLLGEQVSARGWGVILVGFAGVLVVVRPGLGGLGAGAGYATGAALFYALHALALRRLGHSDGATATTIWGSLVVGFMTLPAAALVWQAPTAGDLPLLAAVGLLGAVGGLAMSAAYRQAPAATLAPLDYSAMVWAVLLGVLVFGDVPGLPVVIGSGIIILSGLWLIRGHHG